MNIVAAYVISFVIVVIVALLPSRVMAKETKSQWYLCARPSITPPNYVFPIVWSILYVLIAIAFAQVLMMPSSNSSKKYILILLFIINLILNVAWSFIYFGAHKLKAAFIILMGIIASLVGILVVGWVSSVEGGLPKWVIGILVPYLLWLLFASVLNLASIKKEKRCL